MHRPLLAIPLALAVSACARIPTLTPPVQVPDKIGGAANESLVMRVAAKGVQIYECRAGKDTGTTDWVFVAPEADLFDTSGQRIGRHYAGPRWESFDGSTIEGTAKERIDAPRADAIPWVLLTAKSVGPEGSFSKVTSVQRVSTVGGTAPKTGCSSASTVPLRARVPYTADYYFLAATARSVSSHAAPVRGPGSPAGAY